MQDGRLKNGAPPIQMHGPVIRINLFPIQPRAGNPIRVSRLRTHQADVSDIGISIPRLSHANIINIIIIHRRVPVNLFYLRTRQDSST